MKTPILGIASMLSLILTGCSQESSHSKAALNPPAILTSGTSTNAPVKTEMKARPFLWDEAALPEGYPAPGAVGEVIVKQYPAARVAINRGGDEDSMFMPLFNHIKKHRIEMSSPVEITWSATEAQDLSPQAMAFVYRTPQLGTPGMDGKIEVMDVPPQTYLSVGVRGSYNEAHLLSGMKTLRAWLAAHSDQFTETGSPRYLAYNSSFVPWFLRYGEVQLPVSAADNKK